MPDGSSTPTRPRTRGPDEERTRGQSELVGFLLIFSVVVLTIALVGLTGFVGLETARDFQRTTNAEQAFTALAGDVDDQVRTGAPTRGSEVRLADARLSLAETETVTIADVDGTFETEVETRPIVYDSGTGTTLTYHGGAIIREDGAASVMRREPAFNLTQQAVVIPVIDVSEVRAEAVGGTTSVDVRTRYNGTDVVAVGADVDTVSVNVTSPHADAWRRFFERQEGVEIVDAGDDHVEVRIETGSATVTVHRFDVSFH